MGPNDSHEGSASSSVGDGAHFAKPRLVSGPGIQFRNAEVSDAEFILSLRLDPAKNAYLSATPDDVAAQRQWLERYARDSTQIYFIIEAGQPVGTVRLYNQRGLSFEWGSWILSGEAPTGSARVTALMVYAVGLKLGFRRSHFEVRKGNEKVWKFHEGMGARRVHETESDYHYEMDEDAIKRALERHHHRMPGVEITF